MQHFAKTPAGIGVGHVFEERIQVLGDHKKALARTLREFEKRCQGSILQFPVRPHSAKFLVGQPQVDSVWFWRGTCGQAAYTLEPEFAAGRHLVVLLGKHEREEHRGQARVAPYLGRDPQHQGRLAASPRTDDKSVDIRIPLCFPEGLQQGFEFGEPHAERVDQCLVRQEARVVLH